MRNQPKINKLPSVSHLTRCQAQSGAAYKKNAGDGKLTVINIGGNVKGVGIVSRKLYRVRRNKKKLLLHTDQKNGKKNIRTRCPFTSRSYKRCGFLASKCDRTSTCSPVALIVNCTSFSPFYYRCGNSIIL